MTCTKRTEKKYSSRNSPPFSAQDCQDLTQTGNDGAQYTSKANNRGVYRWVKTNAAAPRTTRSNKKSKNVYEILDNRDRPYVVRDYGKHVVVFSRLNEDDPDEKELFKINYKKIFVGDNDLVVKDQNPDYIYGQKNAYDKRGEFRGNTVLLQTAAHKYVYIGDGIREFTTKHGDVIQKYYSPVGNNAVPYPYAVGNQYTYLLINDLQIIPNKYLDLSRDVTTQYHVFPFEQAREAAMSGRFKTLHKRFAHFK
jgi:hypothetical protein